MNDNVFEKGFVARLIIERVEGDTQIITYDEISPKTFRTAKEKTVQLANLLQQKTREKYPDPGLTISFNVVEVIKHGGSFYVKN